MAFLLNEIECESLDSLLAKSICCTLDTDVAFPSCAF